jgi:hypothetical protein
VVIGFQLHHYTYLDDAVRGLVNASAGLTAATKKTMDPDYLVLIDEVEALSARVSDLRGAARERMMELHRADPARVQRCRDGEEPWPDENEIGFVARCSCRDRCLRHDLDVDEEAVVCNCGQVCPQHGPDT